MVAVERVLEKVRQGRAVEVSEGEVSKSYMINAINFSFAGQEFATTSKTVNHRRRDPARASSAATGLIGVRGDPAR